MFSHPFLSWPPRRFISPQEEFSSCVNIAMLCPVCCRQLFNRRHPAVLNLETIRNKVTHVKKKCSSLGKERNQTDDKNEGDVS